MGPPEVLAGQRDFVVAQRGAVTLFLALLVRRAEADDGLAADDGGLVRDLAGLFDRLLDSFRIMAVDFGNDVPAVGFEPLRRVVVEPAHHIAMAAHFAVDGNVVVVVEGNQLAQLHGTRQRTGFMGNTFHQTAVAQEHIGVMVDNVVARLVELTGQGAFGKRHADGIGDALPQGTGGRLDARRIAIFRVARGLRMQLTEPLQLFNREFIAGQVQQGIDQHRAMSVGQDEAVAVRPFGVHRIVAQIVVPQNLGNVGHTHGRSRMSGIRFLHGVHAQCADGVRKFSARGHDVLLKIVDECVILNYLPETLGLSRPGTDGPGSAGL